MYVKRISPIQRIFSDKTNNRLAYALTYAIQVRQSLALARVALLPSLKTDIRSETQMNPHIQPRTGLIEISHQVSKGVRLLFRSWGWLMQGIL